MTLRRILELPDRTVVSCTMRGNRRTIKADVTSDGLLLPVHRSAIAAQLASCLRLEEDFRPFHRAARRHPATRWIAFTRSGRMLRAPTVFEDLIKMVCTTNCTWGLTTVMVTRLVEVFGRALKGIGRTFPAPDAIADSTEQVLRTRCSTGYRAPYILSIARSIAEGTLNIERWRTPGMSLEELERELLALPGVGPYAAGNMLKLLGRYDRLGLDSWVRARYARLHAHGRRVSDRTIERRYTAFGPWRGLFFWLEMTREWHDDKFPL